MYYRGVAQCPLFHATIRAAARALTFAWRACLRQVHEAGEQRSAAHAAAAKQLHQQQQQFLHNYSSFKSLARSLAEAASTTIEAVQISSLYHLDMVPGARQGFFEDPESPSQRAGPRRKSVFDVEPQAPAEDGDGEGPADVARLAGGWGARLRDGARAVPPLFS